MSKTFVITGGTGGLGTALVKRLINQDYKLVVTYLLPDEAAKFEEEFDPDEDQVIGEEHLPAIAAADTVP